MNGSGSGAAHIRIEYSPDRAAGFTLTDDGISANGTQYHGEAAVDIVAVQGLGASYPWTWSAKVPGQPHRHFWLKQSLPSHVANARIIGFDYNTTWFGDPTKTSLEQCGELLLQCLVRDRTHIHGSAMCQSRRRRPIVFIGHSFGGLVVKQCLILADQTSSTDPRYQDHQDLLRCVATIVFLGTPHHGSAFASPTRRIIQLGRFAGLQSEEGLLRILRVESDLLGYLQGEFRRLQQKPVLSGLQVLCFFEKKKQSLGMLRGFVVDERSACLDNAWNCGLDTTHTGLNKFLPYDDNFGVFMEHFERAYRGSQGLVLGRFRRCTYAASASGMSMMSPELNALQRWLGPSTNPQKRELEARFKDQQETVESYESCQWLLGLEAYQQWTDPRSSSNVLWIHGKPGSGKSVLAAFIVKLLRHQTGAGSETAAATNCNVPVSSPVCPAYRKPTSVMFFFYGLEPAKEFASNVVGTFIHQLLLSHSGNVVLQTALLHLASLAPNREGPDINSLASFLKQYSSVLGPFYIILDALEENTHVSDCLTALQSLQDCALVRILILSQQTSTITREMPKKLPGCLSFGIEEHTRNDIDKYIIHKTAQLLRGHPSLAGMEENIIQHMQSQADGMFQWVKACMGHLEDEVSDATEDAPGLKPTPVSRAKIRETLSALHPGLNNTYRKVFERILRTTSDYEQARVRSALCWLCVQGGDIRTSDIWRAVEMEEDTSSSTVSVDSNGTYSDTLSARRLGRLLGSLLELLPGDDDSDEIFARVCHPSLKTFLAQPNTHVRSATPVKFQIAPEDAHKLCAKLCMRVCADSCQRLYRADSAARTNPLVAYSWTYWAFHLKLCQAALSDDDIGILFDNMMLSVSEYSLRFAVVLSQYATAPHVLPDIKDRLESVIATQRAQAALVKLLRSLDSVRQALPVSETLSHAKQLARNGQRQYAGSAIWASNPNRRVSAYQGNQSAVGRLAVDSVLELQPWSDIDLPEVVYSLGDVARGLRLVALQFAVSPVYEDFMRQFDDSPSIFVFFCFTACFFESVASFPLWPILPDFMHPERAFVVMDPKDEGYGAAAFVRRRLQERERYRLLMPSVSVSDWDKMHSASVKPHHGIPAHRWYTGIVAYRLFSGPRGLTQTFIIHPLHNAHQRYYSHLDIQGAQYLQAPVVAMNRYVPQAVRDAPVQTFLAAIPSMLPLYVAKYAEILSTALFGRWGWTYLQVVHWRFTGALNRLASAPVFLSFLMGPNKVLRFFHAFAALFLYGLRWRFCPWLAAHPSPHPIRDIRLAFFDPLEFFTLYNNWTWLGLTSTTIQIGLGGTMMLFSSALFTHPRPISDLARIYSSFWYLTLLERSVCASVNSVSPTIAVLSAVFSSREALHSLVKVTWTYWTRVIITLFQMGFNMAAVAQMSPGAAIATILLTNIFLSFFLVWKSDAITNFFTSIVWGVTWPVRTLAHGVFIVVIKPLVEASEWTARVAFWALEAVFLPLLKLSGILLVLSVLLYGARAFGRFCADPLDLEDTATALVQETRRARKTLPGVGDGPLQLEDVGAQTAPSGPLLRFPPLGRVGRGKKDE